MKKLLFLLPLLLFTGCAKTQPIAQQKALGAGFYSPQVPSSGGGGSTFTNSTTFAATSTYLDNVQLVLGSNKDFALVNDTTSPTSTGLILGYTANAKSLHGISILPSGDIGTGFLNNFSAAPSTSAAIVIGDPTGDVSAINVNNNNTLFAGTHYEFGGSSVFDNDITVADSINLGAANVGGGVSSWTFAGGSNNTVVGAASFAYGQGNVVSSSRTAVFGQSNTTTALGFNSFLWGTGNFVAADNVAALGQNITANGASSVIFNVSTTPVAASQANTIVFAGGNVGIGTTTPQTSLVVSGTSTFFGGTCYWDGTYYHIPTFIPSVAAPTGWATSTHC